MVYCNLIIFCDETIAFNHIVVSMMHIVFSLGGIIKKILLFVGCVMSSFQFYVMCCMHANEKNV